MTAVTASIAGAILYALTVTLLVLWLLHRARIDDATYRDVQGREGGEFHATFVNQDRNQNNG